MYVRNLRAYSNHIGDLNQSRLIRANSICNQIKHQRLCHTIFL